MLKLTIRNLTDCTIDFVSGSKEEHTIVSEGKIEIDVTDGDVMYIDQIILPQPEKPTAGFESLTLKQQKVFLDTHKRIINKMSDEQAEKLGWPVAVSYNHQIGCIVVEFETQTLHYLMNGTYY
jgi:hypothetical protein